MLSIGYAGHVRLLRIGETSDPKAIEIPEGSSEIGRTEDAGICVAHPSLSRRHARIECRGEQAEIVDLGSKNGTWVGGERIERRVLKDGEVVRLGDVDFVVSLGPAGPAPSLTVAISAAALSAAVISRPRAGAEERLKVLLQVGQVLSSPRPIEAVLESILELAFQVLDVDRGAILVPAPSGELQASIVRARVATAEGQRIWSREIVEYVRKSGVAALFADARSDPRIDPTRSVMAQAIAASMAAPLKTATADLGVLYVDSVRPGRRLAKDDLDLLAAFASQAAIALENSQLQGLQRFFPPSTLDRIREGGGRIPTVETEVTALFCDMSGFTELSGRISPRELLAILDEYFPPMADLVFKHEGTLEKYVGDAIHAIFGAPFARPDDADRAVATAIAMQREARGKPYRIHIGLHTGPIVAGNVGSERYLQFITVGQTPNLASRVSGVAAPGEIVISDATAACLGPSRPPLVQLPAARVKGYDGEMILHRVDWDVS